jgi:hypothetical protein
MDPAMGAAPISAVETGGTEPVVGRSTSDAALLLVVTGSLADAVESGRTASVDASASGGAGEG